MWLLSFYWAAWKCFCSYNHWFQLRNIVAIQHIFRLPQLSFPKAPLAADCCVNITIRYLKKKKHSKLYIYSRWPPTSLFHLNNSHVKKLYMLSSTAKGWLLLFLNSSPSQPQRVAHQALIKFPNCQPTHLYIMAHVDFGLLFAGLWSSRLYT